MILAIDLSFWLDAQNERKADLADKLNPALLLGSWAAYQDSSKRQWAIWADDRFSEQQLSDIEFWIVKYESMPEFDDIEKAQANFEKERSLMPFETDTDTYRAKRADGQTYMRVYTQGLPDSWDAVEAVEVDTLEGMPVRIVQDAHAYPIGIAAIFTSATSSTTASYTAIIEGAAGQTLELFLNGVSQGNMTETSAGVYELDVVFTQRNNNITVGDASLSVTADEIELTLSVLSTTTATILCNQAFKVDWDDSGTFTSYTAATTASNTYSPAHTGDVPVRVSSVGDLELTFSNGNWNFNTSALTNAENLTHLSWQGQNTGTGDIANLPSGLTFLSWRGQNTGVSISATGATNPFPATMRLIRIEKGLNEATVDKVLEWAADVTAWQSEKLVDLLGNRNAAPSAAGDAFIPTIIANGATVQTA